MTSRQAALLAYHHDLAFFATNHRTPVFAILDLEDSVGFEIASQYQQNCEVREAVAGFPPLVKPPFGPGRLLLFSLPGAARFGSLQESSWSPQRPG
jgi:hypothetical protein